MTKVIIDSNKIDEVLNRGTIIEIFPTKKNLEKNFLAVESLDFILVLTLLLLLFI